MARGGKGAGTEGRREEKKEYKEYRYQVGGGEERNDQKRIPVQEVSFCWSTGKGSSSTDVCCWASATSPPVKACVRHKLCQGCRAKVQQGCGGKGLNVSHSTTPLLPFECCILSS